MEPIALVSGRRSRRTKIFLHVHFEDLDVLVLVKPLVNVQIEVATVADSLTLDNHLGQGAFARLIRQLLSWERP